MATRLTSFGIRRASARRCPFRIHHLSFKKTHPEKTPLSTCTRLWMKTDMEVETTTLTDRRYSTQQNHKKGSSTRAIGNRPKGTYLDLKTKSSSRDVGYHTCQTRLVEPTSHYRAGITIATTKLGLIHQVVPTSTRSAKIITITQPITTTVLNAIQISSTSALTRQA